MISTENITELIALAALIVNSVVSFVKYRRINAKIDENTAVNNKQIDVANHVNDKLVRTTRLAASAGEVAAAANTVAVAANQAAVASAADSGRQLAEIRGVLSAREGSDMLRAVVDELRAELRAIRNQPPAVAAVADTENHTAAKE